MNDLAIRFISSLVFIPVLISLFFVPHSVFCFVCGIACVIIAREIFAPCIIRNTLYKVVAFLVCLLGIVAFIYCKVHHTIYGCMFLIAMSSLTDIGAYCFGGLIGGAKLCPAISPNKTWAGLFGGILFANLGFYILSNIYFSNTCDWNFFKIPLINFLFTQLIIISAIVGDLLESLFKRKVGVKDMGDLFPGHGGLLDRLDSLIIASIIFAIFSFQM